MTREAEQPLWSERHGGKLPLTKEGFATLLVAAFEELRREGVFREVLHLRPTGSYPSLERAEAFFSMNLGDPWAAEAMRNKVAIEYATDDQVFDLIELLHRDAVSVAKPEQMENGQIVQRVQEPFRRLVDQPLPEETPEREVQARVSDAVAHFRRRDATAGDRRAAVRELADVLESIRDDVKEHMLTEDERVLFRFANEFAIRHNKRDTRRDCIRGQSTRHA